MEQDVYSDMLSVIDDAVQLAGDAVKSADDARQEAQKAPEPVTLIKVARAKCESVAEALVKTGAFKGYSRNDLATHIENSGPAGLLDMMVKLATTAVFPLDPTEVLGGDLVEKAADRRTDGIEPGSPTAVWRAALDEAEAECAG